MKNKHYICQYFKYILNLKASMCACEKEREKERKTFCRIK